jgi:hypothetical protein
VITRAIRTTDTHTTCDVCGRNLLRGERSEVYLTGGTRRSVCELCTSRALHEGWVREGTVPDYDPGNGGTERRRSLLSRLRARRVASRAHESRAEAEDTLDGQPWSEPAVAPRRPREPRRVHAVPSSAEHKISSAVDVFNSSEHCRTVAGVARSLGVPSVSVLPAESRASVVNMVVSWELCWYRYEVDLSDDRPSVRVAGQGYELDELTVDERTPNATADERGRLELAI